MSALATELRQTFSDSPADVIFVVGPGVSTHAVQGYELASVATPVGLLANGLDRIRALGKIDTRGLKEYSKILHLNDPRAFRHVANVVSRYLDAPHSVKFKRWLGETVGTLHGHIKNSYAIEELSIHQQQGALLVTTNYDHILETITHLKAVTWRHIAPLERVMLGIDSGIIHLNGDLGDPESITVDMQSYNFNSRMRSGASALKVRPRTLVFVGYEANQYNPGLQNFVEWLEEALAYSGARHFHLCLESETDTFRRQFGFKHSISPVPYGDAHSDLAPFLRSLRPNPSISPARALEELLFSLFDGNELRAFLRRTLPDVRTALPSGSLSATEFAHAATSALLRRGLANTPLFDALREALPRDYEERIADVERRFMQTSNSPKPVPGVLPVPKSPYTGPEPAWTSESVRERTLRLRDLYADVARGRLVHLIEIHELERRARETRRFPGGGDLVSQGRFLLLERGKDDALTTWWLAWDEVRQMQVTVRLMHSHLREGATAGRIREALMQMRIAQSPHIAEILESELEDEILSGFVQVHYAGGTLADWLPPADPPSLSSLLPLLAAVGNALIAAHGVGLYHLGLSPDLILLDPLGGAHVSDFGFANALGRIELGTRQHPYASRELLEGDYQPISADIFAFASICLTLLPDQLSGLTDRHRRFLDNLKHATKGEPWLESISLSSWVTTLQLLSGGSSSEREPTQSELFRPLRRPRVRRQLAPWHPTPDQAHLNPFRPGTPLRSGDLPPGRAEDMTRLLTRIRTGSSVALIGPRRVGKTSLLNSASTVLAKERRVYITSLAAASCRTPDDLAEALDPTLEGEHNSSRKFAKRIQKRPSVVLLDELGHLVAALIDTHPTIFSWLRDLGQQGTPIVLAGSSMDYHRVLVLAGKAPGSSFGNDFPIQHLGPLSREAALAFLEDTAPHDMPIRPDPLGRWILELCGSWPYYLQVMGSALVDERRAGRWPAAPDRSNVHNIYIRALLIEGSAAFRSRWNELPKIARRVLLEAESGLPDPASLTLAERQALHQAEFLAPGRSWLIKDDPPLLEWLAGNRVDLVSEEEQV